MAKRIILLSILVFVCIGPLITGCSRSDREKVTTITFIAPDWPGETRRLDGLLRRFEKAHHGVKVKGIYVSDVRQKILMFAVSKSPMDLVYLNDTEFPNF